MFEVLLKQLALMFLYMIPGFVLYKKKMLTDTGVKELGKLLLYIILPAAVINSYNMDFTGEKAMGLAISFALAVVVVLVAVLLSKICFLRKPIEHFGAAFSNAGFMGIPLVKAVIGADAVYYAAAFVAIVNILQWTYGVYAMTGRKEEISPKKVLTNPILISFFIGLILFFLPFRLPGLVTDFLSSMSAMNAPVAMTMAGVYLAQVRLRDVFTEKISYLTAVVRLVLIPLATVGVLWLLPIGSLDMKCTLLIVAAAPIGTNVAVYTQLWNMDSSRAIREVVLSTLLSILTMPVIIELFSRIAA